MPPWPIPLPFASQEHQQVLLSFPCRACNRTRRRSPRFSRRLFPAGVVLRTRRGRSIFGFVALERIDEHLAQSPGSQSGQGIHAELGLLDTALRAVGDAENAFPLAPDQIRPDEGNLAERGVERVGGNHPSPDVYPTLGAVDAPCGGEA